MILSRKFLLVFTLVLISFLLRCYDINAIPYSYLADGEYQYFFLTLYQNKITHLGNAIGISNPYAFFALDSNMPWSLVVKANARLFDMVGINNFWLPRLESILSWQIAGIFLFLTCYRFFSFKGSFFALFVFYFAPTAFMFSRAYMPEPIMMMLTSIAFYFIVRSFLDGKNFDYILATFFSFLAIYYLPKCFFILLGAYAGFGLAYVGFVRFLKSPKTYIFGLTCSLPMFIYWFSGWGSRNHDVQILVWNLLTQSRFWQGWWTCIVEMMTVTYSHPALFAALGILAFFTITNRKLKIGILMMLLGYMAYGFLFTYHIHTHPYYSIQLFLVFVLLIAAGFDFLSQYLHKFSGYLLIALLIYVSNAWFHSEANYFKRAAAKNRRIQQAQIAEQIADTFAGSSIACFPFDGMFYHTIQKNINITEWPDYGNYVGEKAVGMHKNQTFDQYTVSLLEDYIKHGVQYFVVNDFKRYNQATKLHEILQQYKQAEYVIPKSDVKLLVFDLRQKA